jgi:hypothetical protein
MINEVDLLMSYNGDLTQDEAAQIIQDNKDFMEDPHYAAMEGKPVQETVETEQIQEVNSENNN